MQDAATTNQPGGNNSQRINNEQYDATSTAGASTVAGGVSTMMDCLPVLASVWLLYPHRLHPGSCNPPVSATPVQVYHIFPPVQQ